MNPNAETLTTKVPPRVFILNALQITGILAASLAIPSPETAAVLALLPGGVAVNIGKIALGLLAAKPGITLLSDWIDNGKLDGSYKNGQGVIPAIIFALFCVFMLPGCGVLSSLKLNPPDAAGCFMLTQTKDGKTYSAGPCADAEGKVYAYRAAWTNADGVKLQSTYIIATKATTIRYSTDGGNTWIQWSSKAGISLDGLPPEVDDSAT
jgi:hypothetical protein